MLFYFSDTEVMLNSNVHFGTQTVTRGQTEGDHFQFTVQSLCDNSSWDTVNSWNVAAIKILFFKYLRNKNNPGVNYKQVFIKVVSKETCMPSLLNPSSECLSPPDIRLQGFHPVNLNLSLQFTDSDSETYHRTSCSIKCKDHLWSPFIVCPVGN